ncbi:MAG TPA: hypothetical protein VKT73_08620 [Xanthobacteraceae bacterium]|nr:hypothetical protein [Xanthobacteraceae bacterium]
MAAQPAAPQPPPKAKPASGAGGYFVWGSLAVFALIGVSVLMAMGIGASRGGFGVTPTNTRPPMMPVVQKPAASEFEIDRLKDALRDLSAQRDRLEARVDQLEHSVGDITASIGAVKDRPTAPPAAKTDPETKPVSAPGAALIPTTVEPVAPQATVPVAPPGAIPQMPAPVQANVPPPPEELEPVKPSIMPRTTRPQVSPRPLPAPKTVKLNPPPPVQAPPAQIQPPQAAAPKGPSTQVAQILPQANPAAADSGTSKTEFAIDLGGEMSIDGLRARWANIKGNHGAALEGLRPLVSVREGVKPGTVELRLIAGPVPNAGDAAKVCASLQTKGVACRTTEFDGQRLSLR